MILNAATGVLLDADRASQAEPQVIAQHYARARRPEMAIPEYLRAAGQQLMHGALVEAQAHLRKAESLLPELADDGLRREREREICALLGPTHMITGGPGSRAFGEIQSRAFRLLAEENRGAERLSILYNEALHHWATARYGRAGVIVDIIRDNVDAEGSDIADLAGSGHHGLLAQITGQDDTNRLVAAITPEGAVTAFHYRTFVIEDLITPPAQNGATQSVLVGTHAAS